MIFARIDGFLELRRKAAALIAGVSLAAFCAAPVWATTDSRPPVSSALSGLQHPPPAAFAEQPATVTPHAPAIPKFSRPSAGLHFSANPSDDELITSRCFSNSLVPQPGQPQPNENTDLAKALLQFHGAPDNVSPLTAFLVKHPKTRWRASLLANLGPIYFRQGYWSKALDAYTQAWELTKDATGPRLKALADRDVGLLATLLGRVGNEKRLAALLKEISHRDVRGSGTERVSAARASLWMMRHDVQNAFRCGPSSIRRIYQAVFPEKVPPKAIIRLKATTQGTNLAQLQALSVKVGLNYQVAFRSPGASVIVPSVMDWKIGHFSALIRRVGERYLDEEGASGLELLITPKVLDTQTTGYFLVPSGPLPTGWRAVGSDEAKTIFGKGDVDPPTNNTPPGDTVTTNPCVPTHGMAAYNFDEASVSLMLVDMPVGYAPPVGPAVRFTANYNQREVASMADISNLGNKWSFDWLSYLQASGTTATIYGPGGGQLEYTGYDSGTGYYTTQLLNQDRLQMVSPTSFVLYHKNGSEDVYDLSDGSATPRIYRTKTIDAHGNAITYSYDSNFRLRTITDALGQTTVIDYVSDTPTDSGFYHIAKVTDPFGRYATFGYNSAGQLTSITDVLGITSVFTYGSGDFVTSLTTPYGTTVFSGADTTSNGSTTDRWLEATDPLGGKERVEWVRNSSVIASSDPAATVPSGSGDNFDNGYLNFRNTFYWDKEAMAAAPGDYTKAKLIHWLHLDNTTQSTVISSTKEPFENRIWRGYAGTGGGIYVGSSNQPTQIARILDDGTEQEYHYQYNAEGNVTQSIDPVGRETDYVYASNGIDLLQVKQKNGSGYDVLSSYTYNSQHEPLTVTDASGQVTTYTYNSAGQVRTVTDAKGETTTFWYSSTPTWSGQPTLDSSAFGYLVEIQGPVAGAVTLLNYDGFGRVHTVTDSEGYTVSTDYDVFDRPTTITYPDGTYDQILYNRLDPEWIRDRLGRWTYQIHDALRHLLLVQDPLLRRTSYEWCACGALENIIDPEGHRTTWFRDAQGRVTRKTYDDGSGIDYAYENTTSRLKSMTDAKGQVTNYTYNNDNSVKQVTYTDSSGNPLASTPAVSYVYDPVYPRLTSMTDGTGTTTYTYNPIPASGVTTGAGQLASVTGPLANSTVSYTYDELGRVVGTSVNGAANTSSVVYDTLGRVTSATNPLGTFGYSYVDQTNRLQSVTYPNGQVTNYSYYPNSAATPGNDDQRLEQIQNLGPGGVNISTFGYTYNPVGLITSWSKQYDTSTATTTDFIYDAANQLISASIPTGSNVASWAYAYDLAGNRTREQVDTTTTASSFNALNQLTSQGPASDMVFTGTVNEPATVTVGGNNATVDSEGNWIASAPVTTGANSIPLVATDVSGNVTSKTINVTVSGGSSRTLAYDADGNMTDNGAGQTYGWDAANRLISITQGSNITSFLYNGLGQRVQEKLNGVLEKQWIWTGGEQPAEERDASNNVTKQFYAQGEQIGGANYYYTFDHLGSVREMIDSTGLIRARYDYDPYGRVTKLSGDLDSDFGYTGDYYQSTSALYLTPYREYDPNLARWLSRDPAGESETADLYIYALDLPLSVVDRNGLSVRFAQNLPNKWKRAILAQIGFLRRSPTFAAAWREIILSPIPVILKRDLSDDHLGVVIAKVPVILKFDLDTGYSNNGGRVLPVQVSAHEVGHAYDIIRLGIKTFKRDLYNRVFATKCPGNRYTPDAAELSAMNFQNRVSSELGLFSNAYYPSTNNGTVYFLAPAVP